MTSFMSANSIAAAQNASKVNVNEDPAFDSVTEEMVKDKSRLWNSVQLHHLYQLLEEHCSYRLKNIFRMKLQSFPLLDWQVRWTSIMMQRLC